MLAKNKLLQSLGLNGDISDWIWKVSFFEILTDDCMSSEFNDIKSQKEGSNFAASTERIFMKHLVRSTI
jgi:hypothetical protein